MCDSCKITDPNVHIEDNIKPLVEALNKIDNLSTCWSCHGHSHHLQKSNLWKLPQVWFFSDNYAAIDRLRDKLKTTTLSTEWSIKHVSTSDKGCAIWGIVSEAKEDTDLEVLKHDVNIIAQSISP